MADEDRAPTDETPKDEAATAPTESPDTPGAGTKEGERLSEAVAAFERGDYRTVRELTRELTRAEDQAVAKRAEELRKAVSVDPVQVAAVVLCLLIFIIIVAKYAM